MKKKLLVLVAFLVVVHTAIAKVPVYVWQEWKPAKTLKENFREWKRHGIVGVCVNAGMDQGKIAEAAKVAKKQGLEYHAGKSLRAVSP